MGAIDVDLGCTEINADPDGWTRQRWAEGPVQRSERNRAWLLLSYKAATEGFLDPRLSADRTPAFRRALARRGPAFDRTYELLSGWMVFRDPPTHTRLREPVRRAFTPRVVEGLRQAIESTVAELLDGFGPGEHIDLKERFAGPLPALVIADLLGVPRTDRPRFQAWSDRLADVVFSVDGAAVDEQAIVAATDEFIAFFGELIRQRAAQPGEDLISKVVSISHDELSALEIVGACTLLLFAGHETTTNLIASSVRTLFDHPGEVARLVAGEVDATAADELLRVCGPAKSMARKVITAHERGGHELAVGDTVFCVILTANRDPATFPDPDRLDLGRDPTPHLGFGWGMHLCLGANLARLEALIALQRLYQRFGGLSPDGELPRWHGNPLGRSIRDMPVVL
jgi:cytochrome P450